MNVPQDDPYGPQDRLPGDPPHDAPRYADSVRSDGGYASAYDDSYDDSYGGFARRGRWGAGGGLFGGGRRRGAGLFPFPHYSTRTRRGTQVTVGGCCLPLPIGCLTVLAGAAGTALVTARARRRA